jgi:hypothetical protein
MATPISTAVKASNPTTICFIISKQEESGLVIFNLLEQKLS